MKKTRLTQDDLVKLYMTFDTFVAGGSEHRPDYTMRRKLAKMLLERGVTVGASASHAVDPIPSQKELES